MKKQRGVFLCPSPWQGVVAVVTQVMQEHGALLKEKAGKAKDLSAGESQEQISGFMGVLFSSEVQGAARLGTWAEGDLGWPWS